MLARQAIIHGRYSRSRSQATKHKQVQSAPEVRCAPPLGCSMRQIASQVAHPFPSASDNVRVPARRSPRPSRLAANFCQQNSVAHKSIPCIYIVSYHHQIPTCHQPTFGLLIMGYQATTPRVRCTISHGCYRWLY